MRKAFKHRLKEFKPEHPFMAIMSEHGAEQLTYLRDPDYFGAHYGYAPLVLLWFIFDAVGDPKSQDDLVAKIYFDDIKEALSKETLADDNHVDEEGTPFDYENNVSKFDSCIRILEKGNLIIHEGDGFMLHPDHIRPVNPYYNTLMNNLLAKNK